jgi:chemotaxis protein MotB
MVSADNGLGLQAADPMNPQVKDPEQQLDPAVLAAAQAEAQHLQEIKDRIAAALVANGLDGTVRFRIDERGLVLGLVADDVFFAPARAELTDTARRVLDVASPALVGLGENISVEGHANVIPVSGRYPTNWELSADRATQVLRHLVEVDGMPGNRIMSVGFGDTRPLVPGNDEASLAANRRVDLVVLSAAPEQVRALVPSLTAGA